MWRWTFVKAQLLSVNGSGWSSAKNKHRQLWVPPGFAHGFLVTSESADFLYKTTDYYAS